MRTMRREHTVKMSNVAVFPLGEFGIDKEDKMKNLIQTYFS
jgi:hypothetical protein